MVKKSKASKKAKTPKKKTTSKKEETKSNPVGRPPLWTSTEQVQKMIDEYFKRETKPTMAGLAVCLDMSRSSLYNYADKDEFLDTIKKARERMEEIYEKILLYGGGNATGVIFALKNTGWSDKLKVDATSKGKRIAGFNYLAPNANDNSNDKTND